MPMVQQLMVLQLTLRPKVLQLLVLQLKVKLKAQQYLLEQFLYQDILFQAFTI